MRWAAQLAPTAAIEAIIAWLDAGQSPEASSSKRATRLHPGWDFTDDRSRLSCASIEHGWCSSSVERRKVWRRLRREGIVVARCTVERLMRRLGLFGAVRGRPRRSTVSDPDNPVPANLLGRDLTAPAPNVRWVADLTEVATWARKVYVAFVIDCFSRSVVGWRLADHMRTDLVHRGAGRRWHELLGRHRRRLLR